MRRALVVMAAALGLAVAAPVSAAAVWTVPQPVSGPATSGAEPQVATSPTGAAVVVWEQDSALGSRIVAAVRSPQGVWGAEHPLSASGSLGIYGQQVAMDGRGDAVAVWQNDGRIQVARHPAGGGWTAAQTVTPRHAAFPEVAMSRFGTTVVVWENLVAGHERVQVIRRPDGGHWSPVRTLSAGRGDGLNPQVAVDAHGGATVTWEHQWADGQRSATMVSRFAQGRWAPPRLVSPPRHPGMGPQVAMNARGDTVVAWWGRRAGRSAVQAVVRKAGGSWSGVSTVSHALRASALGGVALDATGHVTVAWQRWDGSHYQVLVTNGRLSGRWGPATTVSNAVEDTTWAHVSTGGGTTTVTWETSVIQGVQRTAGGGWGAVIPLSQGVPGSAQQVAMDTGGHAVVVWVHYDGAHSRVMVTSRG